MNYGDVFVARDSLDECGHFLLARYNSVHLCPQFTAQCLNTTRDPRLQQAR